MTPEQAKLLVQILKEINGDLGLLEDPEWSHDTTSRLIYEFEQSLSPPRPVSPCA